MRINALHASFGKLENESLTFHDGLNVIYAPNESGKSTWCAFIRAMLFGVDSAERARSGHLPDKTKYSPWSGAPMEGSMDLTANRSDITITRRTRSKRSPMSEFSAVYTGTSVAVKGLDEKNCGELLTGVSKDVFNRTAFVEQGSVAVTSSPELEKRIMSIVTSGEEQISYTEADERLRAWQRKRRFNKKGLLCDLESKIADNSEKLKDLQGIAEEKRLLEARLESSQNECEDLEERVTEARKNQRREAIERINRSRKRLQELSAEHDAAMAELSDRRAALRNSPLDVIPSERIEDKVRSDIERLEEIKLETQSIKPPWLAAVFLVLSIAIALAGNYFVEINSLYFVLGSVATAIAGIVFLLINGKKRSRSFSAKKEKEELLRKYHARSSTDISRLLEEYHILEEECAAAEERESASRSAFEEARDKQEKLEESAISDLNLTEGNTEASRLGRALASARTATESLSRQIAEINGRLAVMSDPLVISSDLKSLQEEYSEIESEFEAISLAVNVLREADEEMQSRFSPELGALAAEYMSKVTGGRYSDILIGRDFSTMAKTSGDTVARESGYLSAGTMDLLYLAVRLAVCELAMPEDVSCPLIIDDALVNLDDVRYDQAMELLSDIAKNRQVILFTCRK